MSSSWFAAPVAVLVAAGLAGCSAIGGTGRCVDHVSLDSPQQRFDAAEVVVVADVRDTRRTVDDFAVHPVHRATSVDVIKGRAPRAFDVIAPSDQCEQQGRPAEYLEGDPLAQIRHAVLYLARDDRVWRLVTPTAVDRLADGAPLPFSTSTPSPTPSPTGR